MYSLFSTTSGSLFINTFCIDFQLFELLLDSVCNCFANLHLRIITNAHRLIPTHVTQSYPMIYKLVKESTLLTLGSLIYI